MEVTSFLTVRQLLMTNDYIVALPSIIACEDIRIRPLSVPLDTTSHSVGITTAAMRTLSPAAVALIDTLKHTAGHLWTGRRFLSS